jgi:hypothetical protein
VQLELSAACISTRMLRTYLLNRPAPLRTIRQAECGLKRLTPKERSGRTFSKSICPLGLNTARERGAGRVRRRPGRPCGALPKRRRCGLALRFVLKKPSFAPSSSHYNHIAADRSHPCSNSNHAYLCNNVAGSERAWSLQPRVRRPQPSRRQPPQPDSLQLRVPRVLLRRHREARQLSFARPGLVDPYMGLSCRPLEAEKPARPLR